MTFSIIDGIIVLLYLAGIALFGVLMGGRQRSARDYFISDRPIPWWAVCGTIVATETSALTFLSLPGLAYGGSLLFLQLAIGYILGRIAVAVFLIPRYFEGEIDTAYAVIERRFSPSLRRSASAVFMGTRLFADGVRLYTTAIPLALLMEGFRLFPGTGSSEVYVVAMAVLTVLTLLYVYFGGIRAVIWTDVAQWFIYIFGAAISLYVLSSLLPSSFAETVSTLSAKGKLQVISILPPGGLSALLTEPYTLIGGVVGGAVLSMASHGTDQLIVQRVLASGARRPAQRAMILSGVVVFFQFALFLLVGALLSLYLEAGSYTSNEVFAVFILSELPVGVTGLIVAGILAAAMSTLSSSISALSSTTMLDFILPAHRKAFDDARALRWSRGLAFFWAVVLFLVSLLFIRTPDVVVELALSIASYTYGGLLGLFILTLLPGAVSTRAAGAGFVVGILGNAVVILLTPLAWTWYTLSGTLLTVGAALLLSALDRGKGTGGDLV
ncbi:MAG: sodium:solute symporter [Bacteroidota bacterium]|nr:sodium:solute symporter [Bacteroidota bacterium]